MALEKLLPFNYSTEQFVAMHGGLQFQNKCPCDTVQGIPDYQKFRPFQWSQPQTHCMVVTRVYHSPQHLCSAQHSMLHSAFYAPPCILCSTWHSMSFWKQITNTMVLEQLHYAKHSFFLQASIPSAVGRWDL